VRARVRARVRVRVRARVRVRVRDRVTWAAASAAWRTVEFSMRGSGSSGPGYG